MKIERFLLAQIKTGIILVLFTPLLVAPIGISFSEYPKALFFRVIVEVLLILYVLLILKNRSYLPKNTVLLWAVAGFVGTLLLASITGINFERSFLGDFERSEGVLLYLHLFTFFFILSGIFKTAKEWLALFRWIVGISGLANIAVIFQKLHLFSFYSIYEGAASTFTNPAFFGSYLIVVTFLALALIAWEQRLKWRIVWAILLAGNIFSLFLTGTRGAWLGFLVGAAFFLFMKGFFYFREMSNKRKRAFSVVLGLLGVLLIGSGVLFFSPLGRAFKNNNMYAQKVVSFQASLGQRFELWKVAFEAFKERPVLGWGIESFGYVFETHASPSNLPYDTFFDRPHSKPLEVLETSGIVGFFFYIAIFCIVLFRLARSPRGIAFVSLFIAYFVQNIFLFDSVAVSILFFLMLAFVSALFDNEIPKKIRKFPQVAKNAAYVGAICMIALAGIALYEVNFKPLRVNLLLVKGSHFEPQAVGQALAYYQKAIGQHTLYADDFKIFVAERVLTYFEANWASRAKFQMLALLSEIESALKKKLSVPDKLNRNYFVLAAGIEEKRYFLFHNSQALKEMEVIALEGARAYPSKPHFYRILAKTYILQHRFQEGELALWKGFALAPYKFSEYRRIQFYQALGATYLVAGDNARAGQNFKNAVDVEYEWAKRSSDPVSESLLGGNFVDQAARFYYVELRDFKTAKEMYEHAISVYPPNDKKWLQARYQELIADYGKKRPK